MSKVSFKDILENRPSRAVLAMIKGLKKPKIEINMNTYAENSYGEILGQTILHKTPQICLGCAAAAAVLEINPEFQEDYASLYANSDLLLFERAIDCLRQGLTYSFLDYFNLEEDFKCAIQGIFVCKLPKLNTHDFPLHLKKYEKLAETLESHGH